MRGGRPRDGMIARALLDWFDPAARPPMDWRETPDPYRIWVSEVMLQQTTVATALPYYRRFVAALPTAAALAAAPLDRVLALWEGLGYYSRARNLHKAARIVVSEHGGILPQDVDTLAALPGIGRSTAGAIASMAFGRDEPILDANVKRVLARLLALEEDPSRSGPQRLLWDMSRRLILPGKGRDTAMALMDLGNLVCTPRKPACPSCPLRPFCRAAREGIQEAIPVRPPKKPVPHADVVAAVIMDVKGRLLIARRPENGLLGGLWEFPGGRREKGETLPEALARVFRDDHGAAIEILGKVGAVKHAFSHFRITLHAYRCRARSRIASREDRRWVDLRETAGLAFSRSHRKIVDAISGAGRKFPAPPGRTATS